jgi:predicted Zn-dependent protease
VVSFEQMARMQRTELGANLAYVLIGREPGELEQAGLAVGAGALFASYSRDDEREADASAIEYLDRAGIDPSGLMRFFETLAEGGRRPGLVERWFATHPMTEDRIESTRQAIAAKPTGELQVDEPGFERMQARLRTLPPSPPEPSSSDPAEEAPAR